MVAKMTRIEKERSTSSKSSFSFSLTFLIWIDVCELEKLDDELGILQKNKIKETTTTATTTTERKRKS